MDKEEFIIRLTEQKRIYDKSPSVVVTYGDLGRLVEDLLEMLDFKKIEGFENKEVIKNGG